MRFSRDDELLGPDWEGGKLRVLRVVDGREFRELPVTGDGRLVLTATDVSLDGRLVVVASRPRPA